MGLGQKLEGLLGLAVEDVGLREALEHVGAGAHPLDDRLEIGDQPRRVPLLP